MVLGDDVSLIERLAKVMDATTCILEAKDADDFYNVKMREQFAIAEKQHP